MRIIIAPAVFLVGVGFLVLAGVSPWTPSRAGAAPQEQRAKVDFEHEIWPIFVDHCIGCHGPEQQEGQLRLDSRSAAGRGGVSGSLFADVAHESLLIERLTSTDLDERMPLDAAPLEKQQIDAILRWVEAGRPWPEQIGTKSTAKNPHWAYVKPQRESVANTQTDAGAKNPIDEKLKKSKCLMKFILLGIIDQNQRHKS